VIAMTASAGVALCALVGMANWRKSPVSLRDALNEAKQSVYAVGTLDQHGAFHAGGGTAWAVGQRELATNAHVAGFVEDARARGQQPVARLPGLPPVDVPLVGTRIHPGWKVWRHLSQQQILARSGVVTMAPIFDVAILLADGQVGPPLPLATESESLSLASGDRIGYIGYPVENIIGMQNNFPATMSVGHVTSVTDVLGEQAAPEQSLLVQTDLTLTGGASGSPVLNERGCVVALNNAGNMVAVAAAAGGGARVSVGLNLAQRVDLLRELLDRTAEQRQTERDGALRARLTERLLPPDETAHAYAEFLLSRLISENALPQHARLRRIDSWWDDLGGNPTVGRTRAMRLDRDAAYIAVACTDDLSDVDIKILAGSQIVQEDRTPAHVGMIALAPKATREYRLVAYAERTQTEAPRLYVAVYLIER
jgi:hypothetical protein